MEGGKVEKEERAGELGGSQKCFHRLPPAGGGRAGGLLRFLSWDSYIFTRLNKANMPCFTH